MNQTDFQAAGRSARGIALLMALIALIALSLTAMALIRSVDTGNIIAGNLAFRQSALQATDIGIETAYTALGTVTTAQADSNLPSGCSSGTCAYYATRQATDSRGVPSVIDWSVVGGSTVASGYQAQYVLERLCDAPTPVTDPELQCFATNPGNTEGDANGPHETTFQDRKFYYRVTVRVTGPKDTSSIVQSIFQK